MKKIFTTSLSLCLLVPVARAQEPQFIFDDEESIIEQKDSTPRKSISKEQLKLDSLSKIPPTISSWKIDPLLGERIPTPLDTTLYGFNQQSLVDGKDVAVGYLGNWGAPAQSKIFFDLKDQSQFVFIEAFNYYYKRPGDQIFLSTKQPYSNIMYQSGGSRQSKEERFTGEMSLSFNKYLNIGAFIDYSYARGYYQYLSNKQLNTNAFVSYTGEKYQMHAFVGTNAYNNSENGGITNPLYTAGKVDGDDINRNQSLNFPTYMRETWNRLYGTQIYMTNKYNVGFKSEDNSSDSIPMASFIFTTHYEDQRRRFYSNQTNELDNYYGYDASNIVGGNKAVNDRMSFWSFKNTLGVGINEGFRNWAKFGLTAFIQQDIRKFKMPTESNPWILQDASSQNSTYIGGILSKEKGKYLRYSLLTDFGVMGYNAGEFKLIANINSTIKLNNKDLIVSANGYIKSLKPTFFQNNFNSKYYNWKKDFDDIRRVYVGGDMYFPHTQTRLSGGVENIQNLIYFGARENKRTSILQDGESIQVLSLKLDQNLTFGFFHWNNQLVFQTSSNDAALPLPRLSLYSNAFVQFKVAKVLKIEMGVDAHYFTKYYSPGYDPALLQFYNQREQKIGNFPIATAYANLHLKKTRFFLMMYNIFQNIDNSQYFTLPNYPVDPMIFKFGLSWNFTN